MPKIAATERSTPWGRFGRLSLISALLPAVLLLVGCRTELLRAQPEEVATHVVAVLQQHGVEASKQLDDPEKNLWRVEVPDEQSHRAFALLKEHKLPREEGRRYRDIFGKSQLMPTVTEQQVLSLEGLQGEVSHSLASLDGVISARVHIVQPERDAAQRLTAPAKASVLLEYQPSAEGAVAPILTSEVQRLVAGAVPQLAPEHVQVVMKPTAVARPGVSRAVAASLVAFGPLVVEEGGLTVLKLGISLAIVLLAGLGWLALWQAREIADLRQQIQDRRRGQALVANAKGRPGDPAGAATG
jgi:type III secretion protein J